MRTKWLEQIEMSLLMENQNYELFCHGTTDSLKYRLCSEIETSTESYYTAFVIIWVCKRKKWVKIPCFLQSLFYSTQKHSTLAD